MGDLVRIEKNDAFTDSLIIANGAGIAHRRVITHIKKHEKELKELGLFVPYGTKSTGGRPEIIYTMNEPQASFLITLLKNTPAVVAFKLALVKEFYAMRCLLAQKQTQEWLTARQEGKKVRLHETDAIKALTIYAKAQGSTNYEMLYVTYSKLVKGLGEYDKRDNTSAEILQLVATLERLLQGIIALEMENGTYYKVIYQKAKAELQAITKAWNIGQPTALPA